MISSVVVLASRATGIECAELMAMLRDDLELLGRICMCLLFRGIPLRGLGGKLVEVELHRRGGTRAKINAMTKLQYSTFKKKQNKSP